jgi:short-subunit dehydrogenase
MLPGTGAIMAASKPASSKAVHHGGPRRSGLVTGASAGIGAAFAEALAREQYDLVLVARRVERLEELAKRLGEARSVDVEVLAADLTDAAGMARVVERIEKSAPDLLINNAGRGTFGSFADLDPERELDEIELNVSALVRLTRAALPGMLERGHGDIINVSSMAGFQPMPFNATYGATKAFVNSFTEALHEELRDSGVRVQALCPGFTRTEFQETAGLERSAVPAFAWMEAEQVVEASLRALERGDLVCVPGATNRVLATVQRTSPHLLTRRLMARLGNRALKR